MAIHDVTFSVPSRPLGKTDIAFEVVANSEKLGTLRVSKGSLVWYPKNGKNGRKVSWVKFDAFMRENGRAAEKRTRNV